ncbi:hypothetical protein ACR78G_07520 [Sphingobacterium spiritivorum]|uniref:hypothetical protein n=1 Tax=Sphingobacterium spiritivorum TaxID=258 RepID=UPI003DA28507
MKTKLVLIFSFLACLYGCRQDQQLELNPEIENSQSLKLDFEQKTGYNEKDIYFLNPNFRTSIKWSRIVWKSTDTAYIKVNVLDELSYPLGDTVISLQDQVWIKAFKNSRKEWRYLLLTFIPVETKKAFSGTIISSSILSNSTKIATFSKGENIKNLNQTNVTTIEKYNKSMGSLVKMAAGKKCVYAYVNGQLNQISCTDTDEIDDGDGGIYDDPPPNPGDYYPTNPPIGGSDTGEQKEEENIENNIENPCLKNMVDKIIKKDIEFTIEETLLSIFGENNDFNIIYNESKTLREDNHGRAIPSNFKINNQGQYTGMDINIELNVNTLPNSSQEFITTVIVHESIHAYLNYKGFVYATNQHDIMLTNYISLMANYLSNKFEIPIKDAYALSMGGLQNSINDQILQNLKNKLGQQFPNNNERLNLQDQYRSGYKGKKCN